MARPASGASSASWTGGSPPVQALRSPPVARDLKPVPPADTPRSATATDSAASVRAGGTRSRSEVRFEGPWDPEDPSFLPRLSVAPPGTETFRLVAGATTDANGRGTVRVRLSEWAGPGIIVVSVPLYGLVGTAEYTVLPGNPVAVALSPGDTALVPGAGFSYRSTTVDRAGNPRRDPATWEVSGSAANVDQSGRVTALNPGIVLVRLRMTIQGVERVDSGTVAVVPQARIAWTRGDRSLALIDLSGENMATLVSSQGLAPAWHPDGSRMVYVREGGLAIVDLQGNVTVLNTPGVLNATWPEFSADGEWIYFQGDQDFVTKVYRIRPPATDVQLVGPSLGRGKMPTPSPDGRSVAWVNDQLQLVIHDLAAGTENVLSWTTDVYAPRWSPDGAWIAYTTGFVGPLMLVRLDGTDLHRVGQHTVWPGISWSPDSKWVIGMASPRNMIADVTTGRSALLTWTGQYPAWRP